MDRLDSIRDWIIRLQTYNLVIVIGDYNNRDNADDEKMDMHWIIVVDEEYGCWECLQRCPSSITMTVF